jgi:hypothetical protein
MVTSPVWHGVEVPRSGSLERCTKTGDPQDIWIQGTRTGQSIAATRTTLVVEAIEWPGAAVSSGTTHRIAYLHIDKYDSGVEVASNASSRTILAQGHGIPASAASYVLLSSLPVSEQNQPSPAAAIMPPKGILRRGL